MCRNARISFLDMICSLLNQFLMFQNISRLWHYEKCQSELSQYSNSRLKLICAVAKRVSAWDRCRIVWKGEMHEFLNRSWLVASIYSVPYARIKTYLGISDTLYDLIENCIYQIESSFIHTMLSILVQIYDFAAEMGPFNFILLPSIGFFVKLPPNLIWSSRLWTLPTSKM